MWWFQWLHIYIINGLERCRFINKLPKICISDICFSYPTPHNFEEKSKYWSTGIGIYIRETILANTSRNISRIVEIFLKNPLSNPMFYVLTETEIDKSKRKFLKAAHADLKMKRTEADFKMATQATMAARLRDMLRWIDAISGFKSEIKRFNYTNLSSWNTIKWIASRYIDYFGKWGGK